MATAHQIRDLIAQTTTGTVRPRVPREVRDEVCRYAGRRRREGLSRSVLNFSERRLRSSYYATC